MALATFRGSLRNFAGNFLASPRAWVHPDTPSVRPGSHWVLSDKPIEVSVSSTGYFEVDLEVGYRYRLEVVSPDPAHGRVSRSWWSRPFTTVGGGGDIGDLIGLPENNGMILVLQSNPNPNTHYQQYVYNERTGDLYGRTS